MDANTRIRKKLKKRGNSQQVGIRHFFGGPCPLLVVADIGKNIFKGISNLNFTI
jgi:hypothetical protein